MWVEQNHPSGGQEGKDADGDTYKNYKGVDIQKSGKRARHAVD